MKKKILFILVLSLVLLITTGCGEDDITTSSYGYIGGTDGLVSEYAEYTPPEEVLDNSQEPFMIGLYLDNQGETDIQANNIMATLTGIDLAAFGITTDTMRSLVPLEGKKKAQDGTTLEGGKSTEVAFEATYLNDIPVDQTATLVTNVCYKYTTKATTALCLRKDITKKGEDSDPCIIGDPIESGNSGGPIQVVSMVETKGGANAISFRFDIENVGTGEVFAPIAINEPKCSKFGTNMDTYKNRAVVTVQFPGKTIPINCGALKNTNSGVVTMVSGKKATVNCKIDTSGMQETTFTMSPEVIISYMYKDSITKDITIKNVF